MVANKATSAGNTGSPQTHWTTLTTEEIHVLASQRAEAHQFGTFKVTLIQRELCPEERMGH